MTTRSTNGRFVFGRTEFTRFSSNKIVLVYELKWYPLSSCFFTGTRFTFQIPRFLCENSPSCVFFYPFINLVQAYRGCFRLSHECSTRFAIRKGTWSEIRGRAGDKRDLFRGAINYSGTQFIVAVPNPNPITSRSPCPIGD